MGSRLLVVHVHRTDARTGYPSRVGFVVSRAVGGAVRRNLVKRRLREIMRAELPVLPTGLDVVVRANPAAAEASFEELRETLISLCHRGFRRIEAAG